MDACEGQRIVESDVSVKSSEAGCLAEKLKRESRRGVSERMTPKNHSLALG
jgi:hypothetical protein